MKTCNQCELAKPLDDFAVNPAGKDGRHSQCRACKKAKDARRYEAKEQQRRAKRAVKRVRTHTNKTRLIVARKRRMRDRRAAIEAREAQRRLEIDQRRFEREKVRDEARELRDALRAQERAHKQEQRRRLKLWEDPQVVAARNEALHERVLADVKAEASDELMELIAEQQKDMRYNTIWSKDLSIDRAVGYHGTDPVTFLDFETTVLVA